MNIPSAFSWKGADYMRGVQSQPVNSTDNTARQAGVRRSRNVLDGDHGTSPVGDRSHAGISHHECHVPDVGAATGAGTVASAPHEVTR